MSSTILQPVADAVAQLLITAGFSVPRDNTSTKNAWAPQRLGGPGPWAVIEIPDVRRVAPEDRETQLGAEDWFLSYDVTLYFDLKVFERDQSRAVEMLEAFIKTIDANHSLGIATVGDTQVVEASKAYDLSDAERPLLAYECAVDVIYRNPT